MLVPRPPGNRRWVRCATGLFLVAAALALTARPLRAESQLRLVGRPAARGPIYLVATGSLGGTVTHDPVRPGFGAAFLFRPQAAEHFLSPLYRWNTGLVLQAEYRQVDVERRLLSGELVLRRYTRDMRRPAGGDSGFIGAGIGGSEATYPSGSAASSHIWFSLVAEGGYEWTPHTGLVLLVKAQYRFFRHAGLDYSGWSFHGGAGIPLPW